MTIASEITRLQNDKAAMCAAIENKGVTVGNVTFDDYAACIDAIEQGGGQSMLDVVVPSGNTVCLRYPTDGSYGIDVALGGVKTEAGGYYTHTYTESGTFLMNYSGCLLCYLAVGGGGGAYVAGAGGGEVKRGITSIDTNSINIAIGCGGTGGRYCGTDGGDTMIGDIVAHGGKGSNCSGVTYGTGGASGSGYAGGVGGNKSYSGGGGAGGAGSNGGAIGLGAGGAGICGYGGGGTGGQCGSTKAGVDGGGPGVKCMACGNPDATNYGGGGGGLRYSYVGNACRGGNGYQGVVDICYLTDGSFGFTTATGGNCCYTCDGYCVHRFTSDGTFTIVS